MSMTNPPQLWRSALYVPGDKPQALQKASSLNTDCLILDLEDAVAPQAKITARSHIINWLQQHPRKQRLQRVAIRINALDTIWGEEDIRAMAATDTDAILLPKAEAASEISVVMAALEKCTSPAAPSLWLTIETARGILNLYSLLDTFPDIEALIIGTNDLARTLNIPTDNAARHGLQYALAQCLLTARAFGKPILDGVFTELNNTEGLQWQCRNGKELGFDGKTAIHPAQLATINHHFSPTNDDIHDALHIIAAWTDCMHTGQGVAVVNGKMIENLHVRIAQHILDKSRIIAEREKRLPETTRS